jgi:hypothetical protein
MLCSCTALSLTFPTNCPLPPGSLLQFFLWSTHEVLELGPESFYGAELISDLGLLAKDAGKVSKRRGIERTVMILSKFRFRRLMFWSTCSMLCRKQQINSHSMKILWNVFDRGVLRLTTAISRTNSSRCCSKTVGDAARPPEPGVELSQAIFGD